jgi:hypothetical protein
MRLTTLSALASDRDAAGARSAGGAARHGDEVEGALGSTARVDGCVAHASAVDSATLMDRHSTRRRRDDDEQSVISIDIRQLGPVMVRCALERRIAVLGEASANSVRAATPGGRQRREAIDARGETQGREAGRQRPDRRVDLPRQRGGLLLERSAKILDG